MVQAETPSHEGEQTGQRREPMSKTMDTEGRPNLLSQDRDESQQEAPFSLPENTASLLETMDRRWVHLWSGRGTYNTTRDEAHAPLDPDYTISKSTFDTKGAAFQAWRDKKFPRLGGPHTDAFVDSPHFGSSRTGEYPATEWDDGRMYGLLLAPGYTSCLQHPDGSGIVTYRGEPAYVRTKTDLLLRASEDLKVIAGGRWWGHYEGPPRCQGHAGRLPLANLHELDGTPPLVDITRYEEGGGNYYVHYQDGTVAVCLSDSTAADRDARMAAFVLDPDEVDEMVLPPASEAERLVMPEPVREKYLNGMEIVTSDEYASRHGYRTADGWRHRGTGDHIVRQGEWYLVPKPEYDGYVSGEGMVDWMPPNPIYKPLDNPERKMDWQHDHLDVARHESTEMNCICGSTSFFLPNNTPNLWVCDECDNEYVLSNNTLRQVLNFQTPDEALDTLGSHVPRDLSFDAEGTIVVRGTFRHRDNEHDMLNVGERWHAVYENNRDMTVFSFRRGRYASGGSGSGMRVE